MSVYIGIPTTFATLAAPLAIKVAISGEASDKHFVKWREIRFSESGIGCQVNSSSRRSSNMAALEMSAHVTSCKATRWMTFQCSRCSSNGAFIHDTVLPSNLVKSRSCEIKVNTVIIALKFAKRLGSTAVVTLAKFQSDMTVWISNLAASRCSEILW